MEAIATKIKCQFTISKKEGQKALRILNSVINHNTVLPILEDVRIAIGKGGIEMFATDLESAMQVSVSVESYQGELDVCVSHRCLQWFFNKAVTDEVSISFETDKSSTKCIMKSGSVIASVWCEKSEDFPKFPEPSDFTYSATFEGGEIISILRPSLKFISNDELRPSMTGVNLCGYNKQLTIAATDAHRLYWKSVPNYDASLSVVLARKFVTVLCEHFSNGVFDLSVNANHSVAQGGKITIISRLIDAKYPSWQSVLPQCSYEFQFNRKEMLSHMDLVGYFASQATHQVKFTVTDKEIKLNTGDIDFSTTAETVIPIVLSSGFKPKEMLLFALNSKWFMEIISINPKSEFVKMELKGTAMGALLIDGCMIQMPLMINEL